MAVRPCPLCGTGDPVLTVHRPALPLFQNVVHDTPEAAWAAGTGPFRLGTCRHCGFSFNAVFDPARMVYDERYDNHVASPAFDSFLRHQAAMLVARLGLKDGVVYDVGCGRGAFLRVLSEMLPDVRCIGIDPSCTPVRDGNLELRCGVFEGDQLEPDTRLVLLRHVLEHIDQPVSFLAGLRSAMTGTQARLYVEVPDLAWTLMQRSFWDFCYEHCNYFTGVSLAHALAAAGFQPLASGSCFADQFLWALAEPGSVLEKPLAGQAAVTALQDYARAEAGALERLVQRLSRGACVLWGMSTKGVMLSLLLPPGLVTAGIDMNPAKQCRFAPCSGVPIVPPAWLHHGPPGTRVLVMNPNYHAEIAAMVSTMGCNVRLEAAEML